MDAANQAAADSVWATLIAGYGPDGGHTLLDLGDDVQLLRSAASGLIEQVVDAHTSPFQNVVHFVRSSVGDQATAAGLIASGLVRKGLAAEEIGLPRAALLDGFRLAKRQVLSTLMALQRPASPIEALQTVANFDADTIKLIVEGLHLLGHDANGHLQLDDVDVRIEAGATTAWTDGLVATPQHEPNLEKKSDVGVVVVKGGWKMTTGSENMTRRISSSESMFAALAEESTRQQKMVDRLQSLGVCLVVCGGSVDEMVCQQAARAGIWVWTGAPNDARRRLIVATGATAIPELEAISGDCIGRADLRRRSSRKEGIWVNGPSPSATLLLPAELPSMQTAIADDAERLLRAAGTVLLNPTAVPGAGVWQRRIAQSLLAAVPHGPGKTGIALKAVAGVFNAMADALIHNRGAQPLDRDHDSHETFDAAPCVIAAVDAGFDAAISLLRVDGRYNKRPSTPAAMRGGLGPSGSPKGMPGDIPPLM
jgi:chaperonin GroEL (HSP60 family)